MYSQQEAPGEHGMHLKNQIANLIDEELERSGWPAADRAEARARLLEWCADELHLADMVALLPDLIPGLLETADPMMSLRNWDRYGRVVFSRASLLGQMKNNAHFRRLILRLFAFSQFFADIMVRNPEYLEWCISEAKLDWEKPLQAYREQLAAFVRSAKTRDAKRRGLTRFKRRELLRLGVRDIAGEGNIEEYCRELSHLAQAACELAFEDCHAELVAKHGEPSPREGATERTSPGLAVYAMGKLGGHELNFSSDIDLIFVYDVEGETTGVADGSGHVSGRISNHEFHVRLSRAITAYLGDITTEGLLYRVDVRLRPEGSSGAMARSLAAYSAYFVQQARSWEKISYTKARRVAGDESVAERFREIRESFIYTNNDPAVLLPEVSRLKSRIDHENLDHRTRPLDLKRGPGGIREIEFIVAVHQLLEGVYDKRYRTRSTIEALRLLAEAGKIKVPTADKLRDAYWFLRHVEHVIQLFEEQQTHDLPEDGEERRRLALRCGFTTREEFEETLVRHRDFVRGVFNEVFDVEGSSRGMALADRLESEQPPDADTLQRLDQYGLGTVEGFTALRELAVGTREIAISSSGQRSFEKLLPQLLKEVRLAAYPDQAVRQLSNLMRAHHTITGVYDLALAHPRLLRLLLRTLGFGQLPARLLVAHPEWLDELLETTALAANHSPREAFEMAFGNGRLESMGIERGLSKLRSFKDREGLFVSIREIIGVCSSHEAALQTTELAEVCLRALCRLIALDMGIEGGWCVFGYGSFGAGQVHLCGDIDLAFFHGDGVTDSDERQRLHQFAGRVLSEMSAVAPEAQLWKTDARLRPDGRNAPLVVSRERALLYYEQEADTWEFQSLTRARPVAGDMELGNSVLAALQEILCQRMPREGLATEIREMRSRLESSVRLPRSAACDIKRGSGGIVDIEFAIQFLQLSHAREERGILQPVLDDAIASLESGGYLSAEDARFMMAHASMLRTIQRTQRLLRETSRDYLPLDKEARAALGRAMMPQAEDAESILATLPNRMAAMRELFEKIVKD